MPLWLDEFLWRSASAYRRWLMRRAYRASLLASEAETEVEYLEAARMAIENLEIRRLI